jgi:hypothetical protein
LFTFYTTSLLFFFEPCTFLGGPSIDYCRSSSSHVSHSKIRLRITQNELGLTLNDFGLVSKALQRPWTSPTHSMLWLHLAPFLICSPFELHNDLLWDPASTSPVEYILSPWIRDLHPIRSHVKTDIHPNCLKILRDDPDKDPSLPPSERPARLPQNFRAHRDQSHTYLLNEDYTESAPPRKITSHHITETPRDALRGHNELKHGELIGLFPSNWRDLHPFPYPSMTLPRPKLMLLGPYEESGTRASLLSFSPAPENHQHTEGGQTYSLHPHRKNLSHMTLLGKKRPSRTPAAHTTLPTRLGSSRPIDTNTIHYSLTYLRDTIQRKPD